MEATFRLHLPREPSRGASSFAGAGARQAGGSREVPWSSGQVTGPGLREDAMPFFFFSWRVICVFVNTLADPREAWPSVLLDCGIVPCVLRLPPRVAVSVPSGAERVPAATAPRPGGMLTRRACVRACVAARVCSPDTGNSYESGVCVCLQRPGEVRKPPEVRSSGGGGGDGAPGPCARVPDFAVMRRNPRRKFANFQRARRGRRGTCGWACGRGARSLRGCRACCCHHLSPQAPGRGASPSEGTGFRWRRDSARGPRLPPPPACVRCSQASGPLPRRCPQGQLPLFRGGSPQEAAEDPSSSTTDAPRNRLNFFTKFLEGPDTRAGTQGMCSPGGGQGGERGLGGVLLSG